MKLTTILEAKAPLQDYKDFILTTHLIEGESISKEDVDGWIDFSMGDAPTPPASRHKGIMGHQELLESGKLPKNINDLKAMHNQIGETGGMRGKGSDVRASHGTVNYTAGEFVVGEMNEWFKKYKNPNTIESHAKFELIHPFNDGNGRLGRIILINAGFPMAKLTKIISNKGSYISKLEKYN